MNGWKTLLADLREVLRQNAWLARLLAAAGLAAVLALAASCASGAAAGPSDGSAAAAATQADDAQSPELSEAQRAALDNQPTAAAELWARLESYEWVAADGSRLSFDDEGWTDDEDGRVAAVASSAERGEGEAIDLTDNAEASATVTETTFAVLLADGSTTLGTLTETASSETTLDLTIAAVSSAKAFTAYATSSELAVSDPYGDLPSLLGGSTDALTASLREWASSNAPDATSATWDGTSTTDRRQGTVEVTMELDDASSSSVTATYAPVTGIITVRKD